jgi:6-phosphogluconolactonase
VLALQVADTLSFVVAPVSSSSVFCRRNTLSSTTSSTTIFSTNTFPSVSPDQVDILSDADAVGERIRSIVETAAMRAIAEHGHFYLAIPGGSILKMLVGSKGEWTKSTTIAYVNHKCVSMDDEKLATHAKAMNLFLKDWEGCNAIVMDGTDNGPVEAMAYQSKLESLKDLPKTSDGLPMFDLALIGVGDDGHVGSLYPNRDEVMESTKWVLCVEMKDPPSISLSLPVMASAKEVVVAACGVSEKYPQGKSDAMKRAVVNEDETLQSFPAVGLRERAIWVMDEAAASKLGDAYKK